MNCPKQGTNSKESLSNLELVAFVAAKGMRSRIGVQCVVMLNSLLNFTNKGRVEIGKDRYLQLNYLEHQSFPASTQTGTYFINLYLRRGKPYNSPIKRFHKKNLLN